MNDGAIITLIKIKTGTNLSHHPSREAACGLQQPQSEGDSRPLTKARGDQRVSQSRAMGKDHRGTLLPAPPLVLLSCEM